MVFWNKKNRAREKEEEAPRLRSQLTNFFLIDRAAIQEKAERQRAYFASEDTDERMAQQAERNEAFLRSLILPGLILLVLLGLYHFLG